MTYFISATVRAKEGKIDEILAMMDKIVQHVKDNEPDTLQYQILRSSEVPTEFTVWEEYTDEKAFKSFAKSIPETCDVDIKKVDLLQRHFAQKFKTTSKM